MAKTKTELIYDGLKFVNRAGLERYLMEYKNKTYDEARTISSHALKVPAGLRLHKAKAEGIKKDK